MFHLAIIQNSEMEIMQRVIGGRADMCVAIDEMRQDMEIVGYIKGLRRRGSSLEEAIKDAALMYGKTEEYVKEVYKEEVA